MLGSNGNTWKGAATALTDTEWLKLANRRHGAYVLVSDQTVEMRDSYLKVMGRFTLETRVGGRNGLRVMSHTDYVQARMGGA